MRGRITNMHSICKDTVIQITVTPMTLHGSTFPNSKPISADSLLHTAHGSQNGGACFLRCQHGKSFGGWKFQIDAHTVSQIACLFQKFIGSVWNRFYMDITIEAIFVTKQVKCLIHQLHRVGWIFAYRRT